MKKIMKQSMCAFFAASAVLTGFLLSCEKITEKDGCELLFSFSNEYQLLVEKITTKADGYQLPDTNNFILVITDSQGQEIFHDRYSNRPNKLEVSEGTYEVKVYSGEFNEPAFDEPQYGDVRTVEVTSGKSVRVTLDCRQMNAGIKIIYKEDFKTKFPTSTILIVKGDIQLEYPYQEERVAYFEPGKVVLRLVSGEESKRILSRELNSMETIQITMSVAAPEMMDAGFHIEVNTSVTNVSEMFEYGRGNDGSIKSKALSVADALELAGEEDLWVKGYVVGGDVETASISFEPPFEKSSNLAIALDINERDRSKIMTVELKSTKLKEGLSLVEHPDYLHRIVYLKGDINASYLGCVGLKNVSDFEVK